MAHRPDLWAWREHTIYATISISRISLVFSNVVYKGEGKRSHIVLMSGNKTKKRPGLAEFCGGKDQ